MARIEGRCVDNAIGLDGCQQPEVQSKVDVLGGPPAAEAAVGTEHRLNLTRSRETDRENGYENRSPVFLATSDPLLTSVIIVAFNLNVTNAGPRTVKVHCHYHRLVRARIPLQTAEHQNRALVRRSLEICTVAVVLNTHIHYIT